MVKEFGKEVQETAINMREIINKIKKKDMEYLFGKMVIFIKETIQMI